MLCLIGEKKKARAWARPGSRTDIGERLSGPVFSSARPDSLTFDTRITPTIRRGDNHGPHLPHNRGKEAGKNEKDDGLAHGTLRCHGARTDAGAFGWTQSNGRKDIRTFYIVK